MNDIQRRQKTDQMNATLRDWFAALSTHQREVISDTLLSKMDAAVLLEKAVPAMEYSLALAMFCNLRDTFEATAELEP